MRVPLQEPQRRRHSSGFTHVGPTPPDPDRTRLEDPNILKAIRLRNPKALNPETPEALKPRGAQTPRNPQEPPQAGIRLELLEPPSF